MRTARTPAATLHAIAGSPTQDGCESHSALCVVCAQPSPRTARYDDWQGATFTDQSKLRGHGLSDRVCEACVWAHSWVVPPGHPLPERGKKGVNLRLFWHAYDEGGEPSYVYGNKGDKATLRAWLRAPKRGAWWCAIADSGQKHTLPWTRVNAAGSRGAVVRFEERDVVLGSWSLLDRMTEALTAGVTKAEIEAQDYGPRAWSLAESHVRVLMEFGQREGGSGWWSLALWLAQRDEEAVEQRLAAERETKAAKAAERKAARGSKSVEGRGEGRARAGGAGRASGVPGGGGESAQALGPAPRGGGRRGAVERGRRDVGLDAPAPAQPERAEPGQLDLFGSSGAGGRR